MFETYEHLIVTNVPRRLLKALKQLAVPKCSLHLSDPCTVGALYFGVNFDPVFMLMVTCCETNFLHAVII